METDTCYFHFLVENKQFACLKTLLSMSNYTLKTLLSMSNYTLVRSQDVGTHPRGEALEVRCNLVMEEEVPGLVLEMQSRRNTVALCVVTDHVQKHVHQERGVAGHLRKT